MGRQTFDRIKKTLAILLAVFLILTVTVASVGACSSKTAKSSENNGQQTIMYNGHAIIKSADNYYDNEGHKVIPYNGDVIIVHNSLAQEVRNG